MKTEYFVSVAWKTTRKGQYDWATERPCFSWEEAVAKAAEYTAANRNDDNLDALHGVAIERQARVGDSLYAPLVRFQVDGRPTVWGI